ncbi:MAG: hypothetical protein ACN6O7_22220 [Sphingobacterium sp.]
MLEIKEEIEQHLHIFLTDLKKEYKGDKSAIVVIHKYISGDEITPEDDLLLRTQLVDSLKIIGIVVPLIVIPGSSILLPLLIKESEKHHIEIMPSAFEQKKYD